MTKITFIGAGSTVFAKNLMGDILSFPELANSTISLHDIDAERLRTSEIVAHRVAEALGVNPNHRSHHRPPKALDGADYAISMIQVAGISPAQRSILKFPKKYGLRQTIADTLGIGGIMRGLRTIPVMLDMCNDMERTLPGRDLPAIRQPDGDELLASAAPRPSRRSVCATASRGRPSSLPMTLASPLRKSTMFLRGYQPHGVLPEV